MTGTRNAADQGSLVPVERRESPRPDQRRWELLSVRLRELEETLALAPGSPPDRLPDWLALARDQAAELRRLASAMPSVLALTAWPDASAARSHPM